MFSDSYLTANIEFRNKACILGKYYSYTEVIFGMFVFIYMYNLFCSVSQLVLLVLLSGFLRVIGRHSGFVFIHQNDSGCTGLIPAIPGVK